MTPGDDDLLDWDAFERLQKRSSVVVPAGSVSITTSSVNVSRFARHFEGKDRVDVYFQPTAILVVPSEDPLAYSLKGRSFSAHWIVRRLHIERGYYPAEWIEGKGLLIDIRPQPQGEDPFGKGRSLEGALDG